MTKQTIYQPHFFVDQDEYEEVKDKIREIGGLAEYVMYPNDEGTFMDVGIEYQGVAYINKDNKVKPLQ